MNKQFKPSPQCIYGSPCKLVCINPACRKPGFICQNGMVKKQQCALFHQNCQKMKWTEFENMLYDNPFTKIPQFTYFQDEMQLFFSNLLKKLKEEHVKFKLWSRTFGYSEQLMTFIHMINDGNFNQISGLYMNQILSQIFTKQKNKIDPNFSIEAITKIQQKFKDLIDQIPKVYKFQQQYKTKSSGLKEQTVQKKYQIFDSKITTQFDYIKSLFRKSKPKSFKLLYRASDCEFSAFQFHKRCDNVPDTLLLVKTQYGKVIGGFTPLPWDSQKKNWVKDQSLESFLFSLDLKQNFQLNLMQFAINSNPDKGPVFGCSDLCIVDKSNLQKSFAQFPMSYNNFKYTKSSETNLAFTGSPQGKFCTKQWQVFHIQFQQLSQS